MPWAQCGGTLARVPSSLRGLIFTYTYIHTYVHTYRDRYAKVYINISIYIYVCIYTVQKYVNMCIWVLFLLRELETPLEGGNYRGFTGVVA